SVESQREDEGVREARVDAVPAGPPVEAFDDPVVRSRVHGARPVGLDAQRQHRRVDQTRAEGLPGYAAVAGPEYGAAERADVDGARFFWIDRERSDFWCRKPGAPPAGAAVRRLEDRTRRARRTAAETRVQDGWCLRVDHQGPDVAATQPRVAGRPRAAAVDALEHAGARCRVHRARVSGVDRQGSNIPAGQPR